MDEKVVNFDICIIGGSIAGNYLSYLLSKTTLDILVIEEHKEVGLPFQCAGIVSQKLSKLIKLPKEIVLNRVNIAKIVAPSGRFIRLSGEETPYIIDRIALDQYFYTKTKKSTNIHYSLGEKLISFKYVKENHQNFIMIQTSLRLIKTRLLIGCDGPLSVIGQHLGICNKKLYAVQIRVKGDFDQDEAAMYFDPRWKELFGWIVPEGNKIYRVGIASSRKVMIKFHSFLKKLKIDINNKLDQQGGIIPYGIMNRVAFNNILLLGDSAGQVKATTGGGIIMLLTAAKYASNCIKKCFENTDFSRKFIKKHYEKPCLTKIGNQLKIHYIIRLFLEHFDSLDYEKFILIAKSSKIKNIISFYGDMDFPKSLVIKLMFKPIIFTFLIRFFIKNPLLLLQIIQIILLK